MNMVLVNHKIPRMASDFIFYDQSWTTHLNHIMLMRTIMLIWTIREFNEKINEAVVTIDDEIGAEYQLIIHF